jgi:purine-cytosine permease-like protein
VATPNWRRWKVTLATGLATTVAALFPALVMQLLDFVALYGLILMPMGAVIFADFWLMPKLGLEREAAEKWSSPFSLPAFFAWVGSVAVSFALPIEIFFKALPAWFIAVATYVVLSYALQRARVPSREVAR